MPYYYCGPLKLNEKRKWKVRWWSMKCVLCKKSTSLKLALNHSLKNCCKFTLEYLSPCTVDCEFVQCSVPLLAVGRRAMGTYKLQEIGLGGESEGRRLHRVSNLREEGYFKNKIRILFIIHSFVEKTLLQFRKSTHQKQFSLTNK